MFDKSILPTLANVEYQAIPDVGSATSGRPRVYCRCWRTTFSTARAFFLPRSG